MTNDIIRGCSVWTWPPWLRESPPYQPYILQNMDAGSYRVCEKLIPSTYVQQGAQARKSHENLIRHLLEQVRPRDRQIAGDFLGKVGCGGSREPLSDFPGAAQRRLTCDPLGLTPFLVRVGNEPSLT